MPAEQVFDIPIIALEGLDNVGKTTLLHSLRDDPDLSEVLMTGEFESCVGRLLKGTTAWPRDPILKLFGFAADRAFRFEEISLLRQAPRVIVWDRYVDSAAAYREAELRTGRFRYGRVEAEYINSLFPAPVKVLYLDLPLDKVRERNLEEADFLAVVAKVYAEIAAERGDAYVPIDANRPEKEILEHAKREILAVLRSA